MERDGEDRLMEEKKIRVEKIKNKQEISATATGRKSESREQLRTVQCYEEIHIQFCCCLLFTAPASWTLTSFSRHTSYFLLLT